MFKETNVKDIISQVFSKGQKFQAKIELNQEYATQIKNELVDAYNTISERLDSIGHPELSSPFTSDDNKPDPTPEKNKLE